MAFVIYFIYFFINEIFLPHGALWTMAFTPFFWLYMHYKCVRLAEFRFAIVALIAFVIHFLTGVKDSFSYLKTTANLFTVYIFGYTIYLYLKNNPEKFDPLVRKITIVNFFVTLGCLALLATPFGVVPFSFSSVSRGVDGFPRLRMLTYEPSYYAFLMAPIVAYFFVEAYYAKRWKMFILAVIPFFLSFSFGSIFIMTGSVMLFFLRNFKKAFVFLCVCLFGIICAALVLISYFPNNAFIKRTTNIVNGKDVSVNARALESFYFASSMIENGHEAFGIGAGQSKIVGDKMIKSYYDYDENFTLNVTLPNVAADTLATFGFIGLTMRLIILIWLYHKTRVKYSDFRRILFTYMFIYQFVGSYLTNIAEIFIWVLCFLPIFPNNYFKAKLGTSR